MRFFLMAIAALTASGCITTGKRTITSDPPGATVTVEGFGECETPCSIRIDQRRLVTVAKAGYRAQRFLIGPKGNEVYVLLELAAASEAVDETALPSID